MSKSYYDLETGVSGGMDGQFPRFTRPWGHRDPADISKPSVLMNVLRTASGVGSEFNKAARQDGTHIQYTRVPTEDPQIGQLSSTAYQPPRVNGKVVDSFPEPTGDWAAVHGNVVPRKDGRKYPYQGLVSNPDMSGVDYLKGVRSWVNQHRSDLSFPGTSNKLTIGQAYGDATQKAAREVQYLAYNPTKAEKDKWALSNAGRETEDLGSTGGVVVDVEREAPAATLDEMEEPFRKRFAKGDWRSKFGYGVNVEPETIRDIMSYTDNIGANPDSRFATQGNELYTPYEHKSGVHKTPYYMAGAMDGGGIKMSNLASEWDQARQSELAGGDDIVPGSREANQRYGIREEPSIAPRIWGKRTEDESVSQRDALRQAGLVTREDAPTPVQFTNRKTGEKFTKIVPRDQLDATYAQGGFTLTPSGQVIDDRPFAPQLPLGNIDSNYAVARDAYRENPTVKTPDFADLAMVRTIDGQVGMGRVADVVSSPVDIFESRRLNSLRSPQPMVEDAPDPMHPDLTWNPNHRVSLVRINEPGKSTLKYEVPQPTERLLPLVAEMTRNPEMPPVGLGTNTWDAYNAWHSGKVARTDEVNKGRITDIISEDLTDRGIRESQRINTAIGNLNQEAQHGYNARKALFGDPLADTRDGTRVGADTYKGVSGEFSPHLAVDPNTGEYNQPLPNKVLEYLNNTDAREAEITDKLILAHRASDQLSSQGFSVGAGIEGAGPSITHAQWYPGMVHAGLELKQMNEIASGGRPRRPWTRDDMDIMRQGQGYSIQSASADSAIPTSGRSIDLGEVDSRRIFADPRTDYAIRRMGKVTQGEPTLGTYLGPDLNAINARNEAARKARIADRAIRAASQVEPELLALAHDIASHPTPIPVRRDEYVVQNARRSVSGRSY